MTTPQQWPPAPHPQRRPPALDNDATRPLPQLRFPHAAGHPPARQPYGPPPPRYAPPPRTAPPHPARAEQVVVQVTQQVTQTAGAQGPSRSVTKERKRTSHGLHLFLTIITFGMWGILVWFPLTLWHRFGPRRKVVTKHK